MSKYQIDLLAAQKKLQQEKILQKELLDKDYLADLRRSPIQRLNQNMLKDLNKVVSQIDLSGVQKAEEMRRAGKKSIYKLDKKDEIGKMKQQMKNQTLLIKEQEMLEQQKKRSTNSKNLSINTRTQSQFYNLNHSVSSKGRNITIEDLTENMSNFSAEEEPQNWIHMDFLKSNEKSIKEQVK